MRESGIVVTVSFLSSAPCLPRAQTELTPNFHLQSTEKNAVILRTRSHDFLVKSTTQNTMGPNGLTGPKHWASSQFLGQRSFIYPKEPFPKHESCSVNLDNWLRAQKLAIQWKEPKGTYIQLVKSETQGVKEAAFSKIRGERTGSAKFKAWRKSEQTIGSLTLWILSYT